MDIQKLTIKSQEVLQKAEQIAQANGHQVLENAHILKAVLTVDKDVVPYLFSKCNVNIDILNRTVDSILANLPKVTGAQIHLSNSANQTINTAFQAMKAFNDEYVTIELIVYAMINAIDTTGKLLKDNGLTQKDFKQQIMDLRNGERVTSNSQESTYKSLEKYAKNLNQLAHSGKLDPVIGRDDEIRRVLQILTRRTKNNPMRNLCIFRL